MPEKLEEIELRSEEVQEILERVPHWMIRWGSALFLLLIIMVLVISWFVKYPDVITSTAMVTTQMPPEKEYAKVTGKLAHLLVSDGDVVAKNTPLAIIENTAHYQDILLLKSMVDTTRIDKDDFRFPLESLPILFLGEVEVVFALFENAYDQYVLNRELQPFSNEALTNRLTLSQLQNRLQNLRTQYELNRSELQFKKNDLERNRVLFEKGVISAQEFDNKQLEYLQAERGLRSLSVNISQTRESIANADLSSKNTEVNRTKEEKQLLRGVIQSFNQLKGALRDWELKYVLRSEIDGRVSFLNFWATGQTVNAGDLVFTVIPTENSNYIAKLRTPSLNSGKVKVGQKVNLKLENYPDTEFGMLTGDVERISLVPDNDGFYLIDVSLPKKMVTTYSKEIEFRQEMRAQAEIITEDLRLIERFFYQFKEAFKR